MPNIREQRVDAAGIYIKASDGREFTLSTAQIRFITAGAPSKAAGAAAIAQAIEDALGAEQVPAKRRTVPRKPNPAHDPRVTDPDDPRSRPTLPDEAKAFDEVAIMFDFDAANGRPLGLEMR